MAIKECGPNKPFNIIGSTIEDYLDKQNLKTVYDFCGHGIGKRFHELPQIFHFRNQKIKIQEIQII
jgi:methionyl aminopeptidase